MAKCIYILTAQLEDYDVLPWTVIPEWINVIQCLFDLTSWDVLIQGLNHEILSCHIMS